MINPLNVANGYYQYLRDKLGILPDDIREMAERRLKTCTDKTICTELNERQYRCEICHCPILMKTKVKNEWCPQGFWKEEK